MTPWCRTLLPQRPQFAANGLSSKLGGFLAQELPGGARREHRDNTETGRCQPLRSVIKQVGPGGAVRQRKARELEPRQKQHSTLGRKRRSVERPPELGNRPRHQLGYEQMMQLTYSRRLSPR